MVTLTISIDVSEVFRVQAIDFLDNLLRYDHQDRLTAREAMVMLHEAVCVYISHAQN